MPAPGMYTAINDTTPGSRPQADAGTSPVQTAVGTDIEAIGALDLIGTRVKL